MPEKNTSKLAFEILGDVQKLSLQKGDTLIVHCKVPMSPGDRQRVAETFQKVFKDNEVVVLMPGMSLEVVSKSN
jgi:aminoglycoside N3'-acetyltransferase